MSARDKFHGLVKTDLKNEGWIITHDPYTIDLGFVDFYSNSNSQKSDSLNSVRYRKKGEITMDKIEIYHQHIQELMIERAKLRSPRDSVKTETVFDTKQDRYLLVHVGWRDSSTRIYGCIIQVDIINIDTPVALMRGILGSSSFLNLTGRIQPNQRESLPKHISFGMPYRT